MALRAGRLPIRRRALRSEHEHDRTTITREPITQEGIRQLAETPGPCITIVLEGNEAGDTAIGLKDALNSIRPQLRERGFDPEELLSPR